MKLFILALFVFLAGCATSAKYGEKCASYVGMSPDLLVAQWGAPASIYKMDDGRKLFTYVSDAGSSYQTTYNQYAQQAYTSGGPRVCKTEFIVGASGTIESWKFQGHCKSK